MKKSIRILLAFVLLVTLLAGCASKAAETPAPTPDAPEAPVVETAAELVRVGLVSSSSGFGDNAFNDLTLRGVDRAVAEFGIEYDKIAIKAVGDIELSLRDMASTEEYQIIICLTYEAIEALKIVSAEYPEQYFAILDTSVEAPNVASYMTKDQEASFMVGAMAALMIEDGLSDAEKLGFIGGVDAPNIRIFYSGYCAGAKYVDKDIQIYDDYVGSFTDVTTAKEIAATMNSQGAGIIFHAAGMAGNGLFQAAKENSTYAFGVNTNQNAIEPDRIAGSMIKNVDVAAFEAIKSVVDGTFQPGVRALSLDDGGVDLVTEGSNIVISADKFAVLEEIRSKIASGEIVVPTNVVDLESFISSLS